MDCPFCNSVKTRVMDTQDDGDCVLRRRVCEMCARRFVTIEIQSFDRDDELRLSKLRHEKHGKKIEAADGE